MLALVGDVGCDERPIKDEFKAKTSWPKEFDHPPLYSVVITSPLVKLTINALLSFVAVFRSPDRVRTGLQAASRGTDVSRVTVNVFNLHGQGVLCPMVPVNDGPTTSSIGPPGTVIVGTGIPEATMLMACPF